jgi:hypothetical protein
MTVFKEKKHSSDMLAWSQGHQNLYIPYCPDFRQSNSFFFILITQLYVGSLYNVVLLGMCFSKIRVQQRTVGKHEVVRHSTTFHTSVTEYSVLRRKFFDLLYTSLEPPSQFSFFQVKS